MSLGATESKVTVPTVTAGGALPATSRSDTATATGPSGGAWAGSTDQAQWHFRSALQAPQAKGKVSGGKPSATAVGGRSSGRVTWKSSANVACALPTAGDSTAPTGAAGSPSCASSTQRPSVARHVEPVGQASLPTSQVMTCPAGMSDLKVQPVPARARTRAARMRHVIPQL
jgi:hypothetical protein